MRPPLLYHLYVGATAMLVPFFAWIETRKLRGAGVPIVRAHEKLGHATALREGSGPLIWFHAASVGESMSVLSLIGEMRLALAVALASLTKPPGWRCAGGFSP